MRREKLLFSLVVILTVSGCAGIIENPYKNMSNTQLSSIRNTDLCRVATNRAYKKNQNVDDEIAKRDLGECSNGELYCANLGLKRGTEIYTHCRLTYQQQELNAIAIKNTNDQALQQQKAQKRAVDAMEMRSFLESNNSFRKPINCTSRTVLNNTYTDCL